MTKLAKIKPGDALIIIRGQAHGGLAFTITGTPGSRARQVATLLGRAVQEVAAEAARRRRAAKRKAKRER